MRMLKGNLAVKNAEFEYPYVLCRNKYYWHHSSVRGGISKIHNRFIFPSLKCLHGSGMGTAALGLSNTRDTRLVEWFIYLVKQCTRIVGDFNFSPVK